jgi:hypothetical protein
MKKINYLIGLLLLAIALTSFTCGKETVEPEKPSTAIITLNELYGYWDFVSYELNNKTYIKGECNNIDIKNYEYIMLSFEFIKDTYNSKITDLCINPNNPNSRGFVLNDNILNFNEKVKFEVISYEPNENILTLKFLFYDESIPGDIPIGGIYKLQKQV